MKVKDDCHGYQIKRFLNCTINCFSKHEQNAENCGFVHIYYTNCYRKTGGKYSGAAHTVFDGIIKEITKIHLPNGFPVLESYIFKVHLS